MRIIPLSFFFPSPRHIHPFIHPYICIYVHTSYSQPHIHACKTYIHILSNSGEEFSFRYTWNEWKFLRTGQWKATHHSLLLLPLPLLLPSADRSSAMALSSTDVAPIYTLLENALSQDESLRKPAETALAACECRPGFCSVLLVGDTFHVAPLESTTQTG
jgi:hypothetical protein